MDEKNEKQIDYDTLKKLCNMQCTLDEVTAVLGWRSPRRFQWKLKQETGMTFTQYFNANSGAGRASLRRLQFKSAEAGNTGMLIWLGKQYLGQADKVDQSVTQRAPMRVIFGQGEETKKKEDERIDELPEDFEGEAEYEE